jgi:hypothetical protein
MNGMRKLEETRSILAEHKQELKREYNVKEIGIFGSYVGDEQKKQGDVDNSVEFGETANLSLVDFIGFENYLSDILGVKADWLKNKRLSQE